MPLSFHTFPSLIFPWKISINLSRSFRTPDLEFPNPSPEQKSMTSDLMAARLRRHKSCQLNQTLLGGSSFNFFFFPSKGKDERLSGSIRRRKGLGEKLWTRNKSNQNKSNHRTGWMGEDPRAKKKWKSCSEKKRKKTYESLDPFVVLMKHEAPGKSLGGNQVWEGWWKTFVLYVVVVVGEHVGQKFCRWKFYLSISSRMAVQEMDTWQGFKSRRRKLNHRLHVKDMCANYLKSLHWIFFQAGCFEACCI